MISSIIAKQMGAAYILALTRNTKDTKHRGFITKILGLSMLINPDKAEMNKIALSFKFPLPSCPNFL